MNISPFLRVFYVVTVYNRRPQRYFRKRYSSYNERWPQNAFGENKSDYTIAVHTWRALSRVGQITCVSRDDNRLERIRTDKRRERCEISIGCSLKSGGSNKNNSHIVKVDRESLPTILTFSSHVGSTKNGLSIYCVSRV